MGMKFPNKNDQNGMNFGERDFAYKNRLDDVGVNVKDFGAVGDGTTDDTDAIIKTIESLMEIGGVVNFPSGEYLVSPDMIKLTSNITLNGCGDSIIKTNETVDYTFIIGQDNTTTIENIVIKNLTIDQWSEIGNTGIDPTNNPMISILFFNAKNVIIKDNTFNATGRNTIDVNGLNCENVTIKNNQIYFKRVLDNDYDCSAIYAATKYHKIYGNEIISIQHSGIEGYRISGGIESHGYNADVYSNYIAEAYIAMNITNFLTVSDFDKISHLIHDNAIYKCAKGVMVWSSSGDNGIKNIDIYSNQITLDSYSPSIGGGGVGLFSNSGWDGDVSDVRIYDNNIDHLKNISDYLGSSDLKIENHAGISISTLGKSQRVEIRNNIIKNIPLGAFNISSANPTQPLPEEIWFHNNTIDDCGYYVPDNKDQLNVFFFLGIGKNIVIENNKVIFRDMERPKVRINFGYISNSLESCTIIDNEIIKYDDFATIFTVCNNYDSREILIDYGRFKTYDKFGANITYVQSNITPVDGTYNSSDYLLYIGATADDRGKHCTTLGTQTSFLADGISLSGDTRTLDLSNISGDINVGDHININGSGSYDIETINGTSISTNLSVPQGVSVVIANDEAVFEDLL